MRDERFRGMDMTASTGRAEKAPLKRLEASGEESGSPGRVRGAAGLQGGDGTVRPRRRGKELEDALLSATWEELAVHGFEALTYEAVATRAATSRAVLYRRWATKGELVIAAIRHARLLSLAETPDTGTLRGDLRAVLLQANDTKFMLGLMLITQLGPLYRETGQTPESIRAAIIQEQPSRADAVWERAIARGEVDESKLTPRVRRLYFDLFRDQLFMTLQPVPASDIDEMLDEIVLPLVAPAKS